MEKTTKSNFISRTWNSVPLIIRAIIVGSLVSGLGVGVWGALFSGFKTPLVIIPMIGCLWLFWKFFSGNWGERKSSGIRTANFRLTKLKPEFWKKGLLLAGLFVIIVQASFVVTYRLIEFPAAKFTADYKIVDTFPVWQAWLILIMGSIVAGICEEAGFRGYMQVPMEKKYGPVTAIAITSIIFTCTHLGHTWAYPILPHIFFASVLLGLIAYYTNSLIPGIIGHSILDVFDYSVWWTDITGGFTKRPIFETGIDAHFVLFVLLFVISFITFLAVLKNLNKANRIPQHHPLGDEIKYATKYS
ncbi:MAG: CPBP family intramembrane glutamic endopeptidase [Mucilaginibacter sp.]